jgi:DNA mismatch repair ATPase MutL
MFVKKLPQEVVALIRSGTHVVDQAHAIEETIFNSYSLTIF